MTRYFAIPKAKLNKFSFHMQKNLLKSAVEKHGPRTGSRGGVEDAFGVPTRAPRLTITRHAGSVYGLASTLLRKERDAKKKAERSRQARQKSLSKLLLKHGIPGAQAMSARQRSCALARTA